MIGDLKLAFKSLLDEATWMCPSTKEIAKGKVDSMIAFIGYPKWVTNKTEVESYYEGVTLNLQLIFNGNVNAVLLAFIDERFPLSECLQRLRIQYIKRPVNSEIKT